MEAVEAAEPVDRDDGDAEASGDLGGGGRAGRVEDAAAEVGGEGKWHERRTPDYPAGCPTLYAITNPNTKEEIWPEKHAVWRYTKERHEKQEKEGRVWWGKDGTNTVPRYKRFLSDMGGIAPDTVWTWKQAGHNQDAVRELQALGVPKFSSPKPSKLIRRVLQVAPVGPTADYFAGSGTTGHAAIQATREDGEARPFLLAEQGEYFDDVLLPRIQKVLHAADWKDGAPAEPVRFDGLGAGDVSLLPEWVGRTPRLVQVLRLESYEGSLNALETSAERTARMKGQEEIFGDDYLLRYFLPTETADSAPLLNLQALEDPFAYRLRVHTPDGVTEQPVDLVETFGLVMGLRPVRRWTAIHEGAMDGADRPYTLVEAKEPGGGLVLTVWRPTQALDAAAEKAWLTEHLGAKDCSWDTYQRVWMNATGALPKGEELDAAFRRALLARDPHVSRPLPSAGAVASGEVAQLTA